MTSKNTLKELGPIEANIVGRLTYEKKTIVTSKDLEDLFDLSPEDRWQVVFRLKKKNRLTPIKPGVYVFSPLEAGPAGRGINPPVIKFTTLFGLLAVELAVEMQRTPRLVAAAVFFLISTVFVWRSFYSMRIPVVDAPRKAVQA